MQAAAHAAARLGSDRTSDSDSGSATPPDFFSSDPSDEEWTDDDDDSAGEAEGASTAQRGAVLLAQQAVAADRSRRRRTGATRKAKAASAPKEASRVTRRAPKEANAPREATAPKEATRVTKRASKQRPNHFAGSVHALGHGSAKQAAATVQLDPQVRFHDGPPNSGGKRVDVSKTSVADFEVPKCGVCMHTKTVGPSRSKGIANAASAQPDRA